MFSTNEEITPSLPDHHLQVLLQGLTVLRVKDIYLSRLIFEEKRRAWCFLPSSIGWSPPVWSDCLSPVVSWSVSQRRQDLQNQRRLLENSLAIFWKLAFSRKCTYTSVKNKMFFNWAHGSQSKEEKKTLKLLIDLKRLGCNCALFFIVIELLIQSWLGYLWGGGVEEVGRGGRVGDCSLSADGPGRPGRHTPCHVVSLHVITFGGAVDQ